MVVGAYEVLGLLGRGFGLRVWGLAFRAWAVGLTNYLRAGPLAIERIKDISKCHPNQGATPLGTWVLLPLI